MKSDLAKRGICLIAGLYALLPVAAQTTPTTELPVRRDSAQKQGKAHGRFQGKTSGLKTGGP